MRDAEGFADFAFSTKSSTMFLNLFPNLAGALNETYNAFKDGAGGVATFKTALSGLGGVITAHPIMSFAVAIGAVVAIYKRVQQSIEDTRKRAEELVSSYKAETDELNKTGKTIDELSPKYEKLSKMV